MALSFKDVAEILKIIDASDCEEVILEIEGIRLVVRRRGAGDAKTQAAPAEIIDRTSETDAAAAKPAPSGKESGGNGPDETGPGPGPGISPGISDGQVGVRAPMVGTAYLRPAPDEPHFVEVGTRVEKGAPLCLIEVMKLYTTIEAPAAGVIAAIHLDDAMLVEFDQLLFAITPE